MPEKIRTRGTVKAVVIDAIGQPRGFGFITEDAVGSAREIYFHAYETKDFESIRRGDRVEFSLTQTERGLRALDVVRVSSAPRPDAGDSVLTD